MHFQFIVAPPTPGLTPPAPPVTDLPSELLKQILEVQREQLGLMQAAKPPETDGNVTRWRNFFDRWHEEFPQLPVLMQRVLPIVERAFLRLMDEMGRTLTDEESGAIDNDFALAEFLDRFAMRTSQIGTILNMLGQMAEACPGAGKNANEE
jgi:hypothetical protein